MKEELKSQRSTLYNDQIVNNSEPDDESHKMQELLHSVS